MYFSKTQPLFYNYNNASQWTNKVFFNRFKKPFYRPLRKRKSKKYQHAHHPTCIKEESTKGMMGTAAAKSKALFSPEQFYKLQIN